jgi:dihydroflavonol-4-reductase
VNAGLRDRASWSGVIDRPSSGFLRPRALVTGATGFIGRHLVARLCTVGYDVRALARPTSDRSPLAEYPVTWFEGDLTDPESVARAVEGCTVVFHLASLLKVPWKPEFLTVNVQGTATVAEACASMPQPPVLVVVSSMAAAGPAPLGRTRLESDAPAPVSIYGRVKRAAEVAALGYADAVPLSIVRPPMVFGEGDTATLKLFSTARRGVHMTPTLRASQMDLIHAADLSTALQRIAERGERARPAGDRGEVHGSGVYQVAHGEPHAYANLGRLAGDALGVSRVRVWRMPAAATWVVTAFSELVARVTDNPSILNRDKYREAIAGDWCCGIEKVQGLGWAPEADLPTRFAQTAAWYRAQGWLPA